MVRGMQLKRSSLLVFFYSIQNMSKEINSLRAEMAEDDPFLLAQICYINMSIDSYGSFLLT